jgi:hypothetical protein
MVEAAALGSELGGVCVGYSLNGLSMCMEFSFGDGGGSSTIGSELLGICVG